MNFKVYHRDYLGDEPYKVEAYDYDKAAEKYTERYDRQDAEFSIAKEEESISVEVVEEKTGIMMPIVVTGWLKAVYTGRLAKREDHGRLPTRKS
jgi:hypothetical protein